MQSKPTRLFKLILLSIIVGVLVGYVLGEAFTRSILFILSHIHPA